MINSMSNYFEYLKSNYDFVFDLIVKSEKNKTINLYFSI